jgi:hypothetical protein
VKTRKIERTRLVPHTVDGETEMVLDTETITIPAPPRDWDQIVRTAVTIGACILVTASLAWTTASIGDLLSAVTIAVVAYAAAVAFDASWIMCMAVEWLLRYDPERAKTARTAGRWALAVSMGAVFAHGYIYGEWVIGAVGALVSGLAKGGWSMAMRVHARPLDDRTQQWVAKRRAAVDGQLAMIPIRRELQRGQAVVDAELRSLDTAAETHPEVAPAEGALLPSRPSTELRGPAGTPVEDLSSLRGMHGPVVYFLGNGDRVKIGTTRNMMGRIGALSLRPSNLLCAFHGGHDIERRFHALFAEYRVGDSEWFERTGDLAVFITEHAGASPDAAAASGDAPQDADDAADDAEEPSTAPPPLPPLPAGSSKTALILAASSALHPRASAADIAHLLAQHGHAVDTAYIRTVLSRNAPKPDDSDQIGKGGGGYA